VRDHQHIQSIIDSRRALIEGLEPAGKAALEGGCGVIGIISTELLPGRSIIRPCAQMRNRGNGKGGGVAAAGLFPLQRRSYAMHVAYLDEEVRGEVEKEFIDPVFTLSDVERQPDMGHDYPEVGLEVKPPAVWRYFVRAKPTALERFASERGITDELAAEAELIYQNSFRLNRKHYTGGEGPRAFVLSHGRDLMILKGVGYAEDIARYYRLEEQKARVWIGHQRYPTRGRVWHPGGAHPFAGLHEALVHNGDFANYHATTEYLRQWGMTPLFITDTEVSVMLFDLYSRVLGYPLEFVVEALAPTPEGDFERLSKRRQRIYRAIQSAHLHGSPDGPWFFIVARNDPATSEPQLIGITDVAMLRPQVFALQSGPAGDFAAIASEKQAIDAFFEEAHAEDPRVLPVADRYWNARGGSCTDGGSFCFTVKQQGDRRYLDVRDKFGNRLSADAARDASRRPAVEPPQVGILRPAFDTNAARSPEGGVASRLSIRRDDPFERTPRTVASSGGRASSPGEPTGVLARDESLAVALLMADLQRGDFDSFESGIEHTLDEGGDKGWLTALHALSFLRDRWWHPGDQRRASLIAALDRGITRLLDGMPGVIAGEDGRGALRLDVESAWKAAIAEPGEPAESHLIIDARGFQPEGPQAAQRVIVEGYRRGWRRFVIYGTRGDRFIGCGLGPNTEGVRIDVYGSNGDYLGSGLDGAEIYVHGDAQDQVGQILKSGRLVIYGSVGQTFLYGAKGGEAFVMGSAAGRPLINAVGRIRAVINGTCLDYCAESFMAGEQLGGGFVVINGLTRDDLGRVIGLELKYPGNNLFSLASGGACYLNDPYATVTEAQLNGAAFVPFTQEDWNLLRDYLRRNEELFGISIRYDLLQVDGALKWPKEVFRKVVASQATHDLDWSGLPA
jgi:glutamate synthase domain-containing protein 1/glutamate synthase domain-containing protein 3